MRFGCLVSHRMAAKPTHATEKTTVARNLRVGDWIVAATACPEARNPYLLGPGHESRIKQLAAADPCIVPRSFVLEMMRDRSVRR